MAVMQKYRQRERTSLKDGLWLLSNSTLKIIRRRLLYEMKPEGSLYMCKVRYYTVLDLK